MKLSPKRPCPNFISICVLMSPMSKGLGTKSYKWLKWILLQALLMFLVHVHSYKNPHYDVTTLPIPAEFCITYITLHAIYTGFIGYIVRCKIVLTTSEWNKKRTKRP